MRALQPSNIANIGWGGSIEKLGATLLKGGIYCTNLVVINNFVAVNFHTNINYKQTNKQTNKQTLLSKVNFSSKLAHQLQTKSTTMAHNSLHRYSIFRKQGLNPRRIQAKSIVYLHNDESVTVLACNDRDRKEYPKMQRFHNNFKVKVIRISSSALLVSNMTKLNRGSGTKAVEKMKVMPECGNKMYIHYLRSKQRRVYRVYVAHTRLSGNNTNKFAVLDKVCSNVGEASWMRAYGLIVRMISEYRHGR